MKRTILNSASLTAATLLVCNSALAHSVAGDASPWADALHALMHLATGALLPALLILGLGSFGLAHVAGRRKD